MKHYFLRIEGVNLDNFVFDTNDLSTIRGGGLLLLTAPHWVEGVFAREKIKLKPITQGASWGLFKFQVDEDKTHADIVNSIYKAIRQDPQYRHATIVVDAIPAGEVDEYPFKKKSLETLNRWRQMSSPSVLNPAASGDPTRPLPEKVDAPLGKVCQFDHVRPAVGNIEKGSDRFDASMSVLIRREYGKNNKGLKWHKERTQIDDLPQFVNDFNELSSPMEGQDFGNLNGKMAVIYLDGNKFGERQRTYCTSAQKQERFDQKIRTEYQNGALRTLLTDIKTDPNWLYDGKLRFETLLWGGDEIIWVVPAWKGWWTLGRFYEIAKKWEFPPNKPLTLASGLVFCHHKAPIHRIVRLAKTLGDLSKYDRSRDLVAYQILESFDHAGVDIEEFRAKRCPTGIKPSDLIIDGSAMLNAMASVTELKATLPKRQLQHLVHDHYEGTLPDNNLWDELADSVRDRIRSCFGEGNAVWLHLLDLWDYIDKPASGGNDDSC